MKTSLPPKKYLLCGRRDHAGLTEDKICDSLKTGGRVC